MIVMFIMIRMVSIIMEKSDDNSDRKRNKENYYVRLGQRSTKQYEIEKNEK